MDKKIFHVYLAKESVPNNESYAKLDLPASPWEVVDALDKVRLNEGEQLYMEIEDYDAFEYWLFGHYHDNKAIDEKHILLWEQIVRII